jgi:membrane protein
VTARRVPPRLLAPVDAAMDFARDWIERFLAVQGIDRTMAVAAQAYTALIPLLIVYSSILPRRRNRSFADTLIESFDLRGSTAGAVREAFAPSGTVESSLTVLGVVLLLVSALSFTRGLQRLYEGAFGLPSLGMRNTKWGLMWLGVVCVSAILRPLVLGGLSGNVELIGSLALSGALWLATPYLLLGRRLHWTKLAPVAVLSTIGMTGVGIWSVIWMPHTIAASARQFGVIGVGFALLTYLVAVAGVLVAAATGGALSPTGWIARHPARMKRPRPWRREPDAPWTPRSTPASPTSASSAAASRRTCWRWPPRSTGARSSSRRPCTRSTCSRAAT